MFKKILLGILIFFVLVIAAAFVLPIVFKDKIKAAIDKEIANSVNADVYFSANDFSVSLFKHFPNITASLNNFGVIGKDDFQGDTLASIQSFQVTINLFEIIAGNIKVKEIDLNNPRIQILALKNGKANWDIYKPDTTQKAAAVDTTKSDVNFGIEKWSISNGYIVYDDKSLPFYAKLEGVNHSGSGDFAKNIFDMVTKTEVEKLEVDYGGVNYLKNKKLDIDMTLAMDLNQSKYTFKENTIKMNDFGFGFDGFVAMPDTNIDMDITYKAKETDFKSLLSLVPGVYTESFKDLKAEGTVKFDGYVKGRYNAKQIPGFGVNLLVNNGSFQYAGLPVPVSNVNVDMKVDDKDGILNNLIVDIKKFHIDMGKNPIDGRFWLQGLSKFNIDANVLAKVNLADITQIYPVQGLTLKGLYDLNFKAKGVYDSLTNQIPAIDARMSLENGYVKSKDFPAPLEQMFVLAEIVNGTGKIPDTKINVSNFKMLLEGEPLEASAYVENLNDYNYDVKVKGSVDFTKITKIYPLEGMTITGKAKADIATKGKMSDVTAKKYDKLPTSGTASLSDFTFTSKDYPQGVKITNASMEFSPKSVNLSSFEGFFGKSDVSMKGSVSNYIGYILGKETVTGNLSFNSKKFNVNEWMTTSTAPVSDTAKSVPMQVVEIPKDIDFTLASSIGELVYDNMNMKNLIGTIIVKNGTVQMEKVGFNMFGGSFTTNGKYDTQDLAHPKFNFDLNINDLGISDAFKTFNTVKALMPLAANLDGKFSTKFNISGELMKNMMPAMNTLNGGGILNLISAVVKDAPALTALSSLTKVENLKEAKLTDLILNATVKDGWVDYKPFEVDLKGYKVNFTQARNNVEGKLDFLMNMDVPAGKVGALANEALSKLTGKSAGTDQNIKLNLGLGGTYLKPQFKLLGSSTTTAAKDAVTAKLDEEKEKLKAKAQSEAKAQLDKGKAEADKAKADAEAKIKAEQDRLQGEADKKKKELEAEAQKQKAAFDAEAQKKKDEAKKKIDDEKKKLLNSVFGKPKQEQPKDTTKK